MTTIAYNHKEKKIAVDSMSTAGRRMVANNNAKKWEIESGVKFFIAGSTCDIQLFIDIYFKRHDKSADEIPDCAAIIVDASGNVFLAEVNNDLVLEKSPLTYDFAIGSGSDFAISAIDLGKSSGEAVEYAATRCIYTGGKIHVYDIEKSEFE